jgi:hypothetical protein
MTQSEMEAVIAQLKAENEKLKANNEAKGTSLKVSEKGALSVYGLGRFPVTLYQEQWEKLLGRAQEIREFIAANQHVLARKPAKDTVKVVA